MTRRMTGLRVLALTASTMIAFAGNSLLCRLALRETEIDPASFTTVRLVAGALVLGLIVRLRGCRVLAEGSWTAAVALFCYAIAFSLAYVTLPAGSGALLLFGAVQATMIGWGLWQGERLSLRQLAGLFVAIAGLVVLLRPGLSAPSPQGTALMLSAGIGWGVYSLLGRKGRDPTLQTAGNFVRAVPLAVAASLVMVSEASMDLTGLVYAIVSGALTSGLGYVVWYTVVPHLAATSAATVQLSVPVLAAAGGTMFLGEDLTPRLVGAAVAILGGVALVVTPRQQAPVDE